MDVGSRLTPDNLPDDRAQADVAIIGSFRKRDGRWTEPPDADRLRALMLAVRALRSQ